MQVQWSCLILPPLTVLKTGRDKKVADLPLLVKLWLITSSHLHIFACDSKSFKLSMKSRREKTCLGTFFLRQLVPSVNRQMRSLSPLEFHHCFSAPLFPLQTHSFCATLFPSKLAGVSVETCGPWRPLFALSSLSAIISEPSL